MERCRFFICSIVRSHPICLSRLWIVLHPSLLRWPFSCFAMDSSFNRPSRRVVSESDHSVRRWTTALLLPAASVVSVSREGSIKKKSKTSFTSFACSFVRKVTIKIWRCETKNWIDQTKESAPSLSYSLREKQWFWNRTKGPITSSEPPPWSHRSWATRLEDNRA